MTLNKIEQLLRTAQQLRWDEAYILWLQSQLNESKEAMDKV